MYIGVRVHCFVLLASPTGPLPVLVDIHFVSASAAEKALSGNTALRAQLGSGKPWKLSLQWALLLPLLVLSLTVSHWANHFPSPCFVPFAIKEGEPNGMSTVLWAQCFSAHSVRPQT